MKNILEITHFLDADGVPLVSVPISNSDAPAILYQEDWNMLAYLKVDPRWRLNANLVLTKGGKIPIARIILDAQKGENVRCLDGSPLNLKRDNMVKIIGQAKNNTRERLLEIPLQAQKVPEIKHIYIKPSWMQDTSPSGDLDNEQEQEQEKELT